MSHDLKRNKNKFYLIILIDNLKAINSCRVSNIGADHSDYFSPNVLDNQVLIVNLRHFMQKSCQLIIQI